jgi:hypothetical protein
MATTHRATSDQTRAAGVPGAALPPIEPLVNTRRILLSWFEEEELSNCPSCGERHVLPSWAGPVGSFCVTCVLGLPPEDSHGRRC